MSSFLIVTRVEEMRLGIFSSLSFFSFILCKFLYSSIAEEDKIGGCSFHLSKNIASQFGEEASASFLRASQGKTTDNFYQQLANFAEQFVVLFYFLNLFSHYSFVGILQHSSISAPFLLQCMLLHSFRGLEGGHPHSSLNHSGQYCSQ